jgi:transcriptional regulator with XRE-family HTH domain
METQALAAAVKSELRKRGVTVREFAKRMEVSEPTMKRWLRGQGLLLKDWILMLEALGLSLSETAAQADKAARTQFLYTETQEMQFVAIPGLLAFFQSLLEGNDAESIAVKHRLTKASVTFYLKKLDDLGLIRWKQGTSFTFVKRGEPKWRRGGPLAKTFRAKVFDEVVVKNQDTEKTRIGLYHLSPIDLEHVRSMLDEALQFAKTAETRALPGRGKSAVIALTVDEYRPDFLYTIPNGK